MPAQVTPAKTRPPGVRERAKQQNQDKIVMAARQMFAERGYDASTLREIATTAGLGLGTLFNYISDKRDLIYLIFNEEMDSLTTRALAAPRPWQSFRAKILSIAEPHYRLFGSEPILSRILLSEILLGTPGLHLERYLQIRNRLIRGLEGVVAEAQESGEIQSEEGPEVIARTVFFAFSAAIRWWLGSENPEWRAGQREFERVLRVLIAGLGGGSGDPPAAAVNLAASSPRAATLKTRQARQKPEVSLKRRTPAVRPKASQKA